MRPDPRDGRRLTTVGPLAWGRSQSGGGASLAISDRGERIAIVELAPRARCPLSPGRPLSKLRPAARLARIGSPDSPVERCGAPAPQRDIPDACRDYPLRAPRGVVGPAGLEPASTESQPAEPSRDTARGVGNDSTSASTAAAVAQLEALVRAVLAAGQVALPRSVRRDLAHLLVDSASDPATDAPPKPPRDAGSP